MRLTDEQRALRDTVADVLDRAPDSAWPTLCEIGAAGLHIPTEYGGSGASLLETCVVAEELGRTLTNTPLLGSSVLAGTALLAGGDVEACARLLPGLADGRSLAALAVSGADGQWQPACTGDGSLSGAAHYVVDGDLADVLLVAARTTDGVGLFEVPVEQSGVHRAAVTTMDQTRRLAVVTLTEASGRRVGGGAAVSTALDTARIVLAAEQVGAAAECLRRTVAYSKDRVQFGRPIGSFQALKHRMADVYVAVETARSAARAAAAAGPEDLPVRAEVAAAHCSSAFTLAASEMIQLHGGIAITWEHDAHLFFKRAHSSAQLFGRPGAHMTRLAELVGITR
ncbi:MAG TPA: acyl-CoA dehydrogenase family protein [Pseudonocardiaceae bacterium]|nr:acyl-CoA dehydrogenase family protein [Pseudonocardiaceae bacterium]